MSNPKAQKAKDEGNVAFKAGDYPTAIGHYTSAIIADRMEPTYHLNRAAAYLKLGKDEDAERDCTSALDLSKSNIKALFRRAQARIALGKLLEARKDLSDALLLEPSNGPAQVEMKKVTSLIQQEQAKKAKASSSLAQNQIFSESPVSTKRRRVPIKIVVSSGNAVNQSAEGSPRPGSDIAPSYNSAATPSTPSERPDVLQAISTRSLGDSKEERSTTENNQEKPRTESAHGDHRQKQSFTHAKAARDSIRPSHVNGGIFRAPAANSHVLEETDRAGEATTSLPSDLPPSDATAAPISSESARYATPKTLFDFQKVWGTIASPHERWIFLNTVPPGDLPALCKTSLEPSLLASILSTLLTNLQARPQDVNMKQRMFEFLEGFGKVSRFTTLVLFLSKNEKEVAREIWKELGISMDRSWGTTI